MLSLYTRLFSYYHDFQDRVNASKARKMAFQSANKLEKYAFKGEEAELRNRLRKARKNYMKADFHKKRLDRLNQRYNIFPEKENHKEEYHDE